MSRRYGWNPSQALREPAYRIYRFEVGQRVRKAFSGLTGLRITGGFEGIVIRCANWDAGGWHPVYTVEADDGERNAMGERVLEAV